jgi:hypothetical protein
MGIDSSTCLRSLILELTTASSRSKSLNYLGLPLKRDTIHRYGGIGSGSITATFGTVALEIGKWTLWKFYAGFSDSPSVVPILGQNGFFSEFEITFNRIDEIIKLKELPKITGSRETEI